MLFLLSPDEVIPPVPPPPPALFLTHADVAAVDGGGHDIPIDVAGHTILFQGADAGAAAISNANPKWGAKAMRFAGGAGLRGGFITTLPSDFTNFIALPYTIECWAYLNALASRVIMTINGGVDNYTDANGYMCDMGAGPANAAYFQYRKGAGVTEILLNTTDGSAGAYMHVAACYDGTTTRFFVNGVMQSSSVVAPASPGGLADKLTIGAYLDSFSNISGNLVWNGDIDEMRLIAGHALYTANFSPPTGPFPDIV